MGRVEGKVALITGGAQGMGAAHAQLLAAEGARVVIGDIFDEQGLALADDLGDSAQFVHLDVTQPADWSAAVEATLSRFGKLDVLVNNAGTVALGRLGTFDLNKWHNVIDVNLTGTFLGMRAV
ncbi:MAG: SDR family NAD(P)-dependent oxidoreductase, partial [Mycobacterium sp.]|uniref:SDR family NAD(P)-dependent oxidoreductase n=1 Tax=Mycobacterium sp. TaxID=1785 RepID=UPI003C5790CE